MLFQVFPEKFFSILSSENKKLYWECIYKLFTIMSNQLSFGVRRSFPCRGNQKKLQMIHSERSNMLNQLRTLCVMGTFDSQSNLWNSFFAIYN